MKEFSKYQRKDDIRRMVNSLIGKGVKLYLWRKHFERKAKGIIITSSNLVQGDYLMAFTDENLSSFKPKEDLYIYYEAIELVFKVPLRKIGNGFLEMGVPENFQVKNYREAEHIHYYEQSNSISISKRNRNSTPTCYSVKLYDLSATGASFLLDKFQAQNIEKGDRMTVLDIEGSQSIPIPDCQAVYIETFESAGSKHYKVGIKFGRPLKVEEFPTNSTH